MPGPVRFTPEELQSLIDSKQLTMDDTAKMHPDDRAAVFHMMSQAPDRGGFDTGSMSGEIMKHPILSGLAGTALAGVALPELASIFGGGALAAGGGAIAKGLAAKVPAAVRTGALGYLGYEGANQASDALGLPPSLKAILGLAGAHYAGGLAGGRGGAPGAPEEAIGSDVSKARQVYSTIEPETDEALASRGLSRGAPLTTLRSNAPGPSMPSDTTVQGSKMGRSMGPDRADIAPLAVSDYREHQAGGVHIDHEPASPDVPGKTPPNVSRRRTNADRIEQVTGSSRNGYADPRSQSLDYSAEETDPQVNALQTKLSQLMGSHSNNRTMVDASAVDSLEQLLNATGNQRPNPLGHGTIKRRTGR